MGSFLLSSLLFALPRTTSMRVLVLTLLAAAASANEYCSVKCRDGKQHTLCKYNGDKLDAKCLRTEEESLQHSVTDKEKKIIVNKHNQLRRKIAKGKDNVSNMPKAANMMELEWDEELAKIAQGWANQCFYEHDDCRQTSDGCYNSVGQNIAVRGVSRSKDAKVDWNEVVEAWYSEVKDYSAENAETFVPAKKGEPAVGHFTQVVWATTHRVGCGFVMFYGSQPLGEDYYNTYYVCNYARGGNSKGSPVYKIGKACSQCPKNSKCNKSLCKLND